jgi:transcriptional regulator with XRE-family HTH domain
MIHECITPPAPCLQNASVHTDMATQHKHPREIIEELRKARGFPSQRALALAADISQPTLSRYLAGKTDDMDTRHWVALAQALETTVSQLLGEVPLQHDSLKVQELEVIYLNLRPDLQGALLATARALSNSTDSTDG